MNFNYFEFFYFLELSVLLGGRDNSCLVASHGWQYTPLHYRTLSFALTGRFLVKIQDDLCLYKQVIQLSLEDIDDDSFIILEGLFRVGNSFGVK